MSVVTYKSYLILIIKINLKLNKSLKKTKKMKSKK